MKAIRKLLKYDYRRKVSITSKDCLSIDKLCSYVNGVLAPKEAQRIEMHIDACYSCLDMLVSIHDGISRTRKRRYKLKRESLYLLMAIICFILSFLFRGYFLQFLAATLLLGIKWIVDSKSSRMLIMIYEAWKRGGEREAGRILKDIERR